MLGVLVTQCKPVEWPSLSSYAIRWLVLEQWGSSEARMRCDSTVNFQPRKLPGCATCGKILYVISSIISGAWRRQGRLISLGTWVFVLACCKHYWCNERWQIQLLLRDLEVDHADQAPKTQTWWWSNSPAFSAIETLVEASTKQWGAHDVVNGSITNQWPDSAWPPDYVFVVHLYATVFFWRISRISSIMRQQRYWLLLSPARCLQRESNGARGSASLLCNLGLKMHVVCCSRVLASRGV